MPDVITMNPSSITSPTSSTTYVDSSPRQSRCKVQYHMNQPTYTSSSLDEAEDISFISHASEILNNMNLPPEHLKEVITAQFATCKKFRNQLVLTMWELEESKRWTKVVKCTLSAVWQDHTAAQAALQNWLESVEKKLDEVSQAQSSSKYGKQQEMLCFVRAKFEDLEGLAITHGMADPDFAMIGEDTQSMMSNEDSHSVMSDNEDSHASAGRS
ncbi:hypothetical protein BDR07DRAFT_1482958 [Suillus spraguei]|nr:hypothetical protein BDR07DRAFT_1482958 [Suillus spraguei]